MNTVPMTGSKMFNSNVSTIDSCTAIDKIINARNENKHIGRYNTVRDGRVAKNCPLRFERRRCSMRLRSNEMRLCIVEEIGSKWVNINGPKLHKFESRKVSARFLK